jgi:hypothetical protein
MMSGPSTDQPDRPLREAFHDASRDTAIQAIEHVSARVVQVATRGAHRGGTRDALRSRPRAPAPSSRPVCNRRRRAIVTARSAAPPPCRPAGPPRRRMRGRITPPLVTSASGTEKSPICPSTSRRNPRSEGGSPSAWTPQTLRDTCRSSIQARTRSASPLIRAGQHPQFRRRGYDLARHRGRGGVLQRCGGPNGKRPWGWLPVPDALRRVGTPAKEAQSRITPAQRGLIGSNRGLNLNQRPLGYEPVPNQRSSQRATNNTS